MAAFGKADIGLIKATAGAEAGQYMDKNLALGSAIGVALESIQKQQAAIQKKNESLQKELAENFNPASSGLDANLQKLLNDNLSTSINDFVNVTGTGIESNSLKQSLVDRSNNLMETGDLTNGNLLWIQSKDFQMPSGAVGTDKETFFNHVKLGKELKFFTQLSSDGKSSNIMVAVPKHTSPQHLEGEIINGTATGTSEYIAYNELLDREADNTISDDQKIELAAFRKIEYDYGVWKHEGQHTNSQGHYNEDKYIIQNGSTMSVGEDDNNKRLITSLVNKHITNVTSDAALSLNRPGSDFAADVVDVMGERVGKNAFNVSSDELQNLVFNSNLGFGNVDLNNDGDLDSFGSVFINGFNQDNLELEKIMYTDTNGKYINWNFEDLGVVFDEDQIKLYDKDESGTIEWTPAVNDKGEAITSEWNALPQEVKENMKDIWLRGTDKSGTTNPDKRAKYIQSKFPIFVGEVLKDLRLAKQRTHFEKKNQYFDNGVTGNVPVFKTAEAAETAKGVTYNNTKFNNAFPFDLLAGGIDMTQPNALGIGGKLQKIFPQLKSRFPDCKFDPDGGKLTVRNGAGSVDTFDFEVGQFTTNTKTDVANEYNRLEAFLGNEEFSNDDNVKINGLGTSVNDDNWVAFKNQKHELYPETRVGQKFTAGQYEAFELDGQLIQDQNIQIYGMNADGKYLVRTADGKSFGEVDLVLK